MEFLIIASLLAFVKFCLICKFVGLRQALYFDKWIDLFFTLVLPLVFVGTFSGMITACLSGVCLSIMLFIAKLFFNPVPPLWIQRRNLRRGYSVR